MKLRLKFAKRFSREDKQPRTGIPLPDETHSSEPESEATAGEKDGGIDSTFIQVMSLLLVLLLLVKAYGVARFSLTTSAAFVTAAPLSVLTGTLGLYEYAFMAGAGCGRIVDVCPGNPRRKQITATLSASYLRVLCPRGLVDAASVSLLDVWCVGHFANIGSGT
jgi:hypothetical protein